MAKEKEKNSTGITASTEVVNKNEEMITCIVRDRYDETNKAIKRYQKIDPKTGKKGEWVWFRLGEPVKLPRRIIKKFQRQVPEPVDLPPTVSPEEMTRLSENVKLRPPRYYVTMLDI